MLKIILNRLQPQAEEIIAEEQAGFRAGRSTTEQNIQSQYPLREIPAASAESLPWLHRLQEGLWQGMARSLMGNYEEIQQCQLIRASKNLYDKAQSAVLFSGSTGEWFRTTVGVRQWCLLSPTLFNIFLERIMCEALHDHDDNISIGARLITNFRFADDIVVNAEEEEEAGVLVDHLDTTTTRYKMEIGPDKTKVMTNNPNGYQREIKIKVQRLNSVSSHCAHGKSSLVWKPEVHPKYF